MQVLGKKKDRKILHLENIYVIIVYKERGEIMGLFSKSKPKESEWVEFHPSGPVSIIKRTEYNEKTNSIKGGTMWTASWDFDNFSNILYAIDQISVLSDKMDKILMQNEELQKRCKVLENEVKILKR